MTFDRTYDRAVAAGERLAVAWGAFCPRTPRSAADCTVAPAHAAPPPGAAPLRVASPSQGWQPRRVPPGDLHLSIVAARRTPIIDEAQMGWAGVFNAAGSRLRARRERWFGSTTRRRKTYTACISACATRRAELATVMVLPLRNVVPGPFRLVTRTLIASVRRGHV